MKTVSKAQLDRFGHSRSVGYKTLWNEEQLSVISIGCGANMELRVWLHPQYMDVWVGEGQSPLRPS